MAYVTQTIDHITGTRVSAVRKIIQNHSFPSSLNIYNYVYSSQKITLQLI